MQEPIKRSLEFLQEIDLELVKKDQEFENFKKSTSVFFDKNAICLRICNLIDSSDSFKFLNERIKKMSLQNKSFQFVLKNEDFDLTKKMELINIINCEIIEVLVDELSNQLEVNDPSKFQNPLIKKIISPDEVDEVEMVLAFASSIFSIHLPEKKNDFVLLSIIQI
jgi:hypothetical protein